MSDADKSSWDKGWDEHRDRQLERWAALPLSEKLDWLEEAQEIAINPKRSREASQSSSSDSPIPKDP